MLCNSISIPYIDSNDVSRERKGGLRAGSIHSGRHLRVSIDLWGEHSAHLTLPFKTVLPWDYRQHPGFHSKHSGKSGGGSFYCYLISRGSEFCQLIPGEGLSISRGCFYGTLQ